MRRRKLRQDEEADINLTPMLDVVFIMLIFFIVTATFIKEAGVDVLRPGALTGIKKPLVSVLVAINSNGDVWIDKRKVSVDSLRPHIERIHAENPKGGLIVQADRDAEAGRLLQVLDIVRQVGVADVAVSTKW